MKPQDYWRIFHSILNSADLYHLFYRPIILPSKEASFQIWMGDESGWTDPRIICRSTRWTDKGTLTLLLPRLVGDFYQGSSHFHFHFRQGKWHRSQFFPSLSSPPAVRNFQGNWGKNWSKNIIIISNGMDTLLPEIKAQHGAGDALLPRIKV